MDQPNASMGYEQNLSSVWEPYLKYVNPVDKPLGDLVQQQILIGTMVTYKCLHVLTKQTLFKWYWTIVRIYLKN